MGAINLDNTGSGGAITLSSDGTSLLLGGSAVGGGADLYAANEVSVAAQPSATGDDAVAIGDSAVSSGANAIAFGFSSLASGFNAISIGNNESNNSNTIAIGGNSISSGTQSFADGHSSVSTGSYSHATTNSRASGSNSFAAAIADNSASYGASGANSVAMGYQAKASGNYNVAIGGSVQATGSDYGVSIGYRARSANHSTVSIGREAGLSGAGSESTCVGSFSYASGSNALALGNNVSATGSYSAAIGRYASTGSIQGKFAFANDYMSAAGDNQRGLYILQASTTDATGTALTFSSGTAGTVNQLNLQNNSAYAFHGTIVGREKASEGTDCCAFKIEGLIRREANAGTTVLVNSATTVIDNTPNWGMALSANTTHGCLRIEVTGAASTNIRWVASIDVSEIVYA